ncbi:MAG TPA: hypothetical protein VLZ12_07030 [Verrucomicrobiae bacterium]|nr:hypothetical protein [Verrucomicrobiae bacterium]
MAQQRQPKRASRVLNNAEKGVHIHAQTLPVATIGVNAFVKILPIAEQRGFIHPADERSRQRDELQSIEKTTVRASRPRSGNVGENLIGHVMYLGIAMFDARQRHHLVDGDRRAGQIALLPRPFEETVTHLKEFAGEKAKKWNKR